MAKTTGRTAGGGAGEEPARLRPRIRIVRGGEVLLGPGMAQLLDAIRSSGSLRVAADELEMSYMHAWGLVRTMNRGFREPLVTLSRGGAGHGGASLTATGEQVLALYREMEAEALRAAEARWKRLERFLA